MSHLTTFAISLYKKARRLRCELSLNHRWQLISIDDHRIEHVCVRCGKRAIRIL